MSDLSEPTEIEPPRSKVGNALIGIVVIVLAILAVIVVLMVLGPATSTIYSNVMIDL